MDNDATRTDRPSQLTGPLTDRYLYLREDKAPVSWDMYALDDAASCKTVGVLIPNQYVVVDVDNMEQADKLMRLVTEENIKCQIMQTTRGKHFWFTLSKPIKNSIAVITGIGIYADYRSWGKQSEVCVRMNGEWREWLTDYDWSELAELPRWLRPLKQDKWKFYDMGEGDGRNQALFDYQIMLSKRGYPKQEAFDVLRFINTYIFEEPMPDNEINTICRNEAYPDPATVNPLIGNVSAPDAEWFGPKGKFLHNILGETLIKDMNLLAYHRELYVYHDGIYVKDTQDEILREISDCFPESTKKQKEEVMEYLRIHRGMDKKPVDVYNINVQNGRLDLKTGNINPHTPEANDFQQINAKYDPEVVCPDVDKMLMRVFCGDKQLYDLFEEMMGYCLLKNCRMQKLFVFFGDGNNGKSTILRVISDFIGGGNYSTLSLQDLETTFRPAELENKLLNIGDDIPATTIRDSGTLKSTTTGEEITVERKNKPPFNLKNYAKMIFTTNKMPPAVDKSDGFYRRLCLIPLDAKFKVTDADFDPDIEEKVTSQEAMSHLLNMALRGYKRMKKNNKFTTSDKVENAVAAYKEKSSTTLTWLADICVTLDYLLSKSTSELNYEFRNWCAEEGIDPMKIPKAKTVTEEIEKQYGLHLSPQQREKGTGKQVRLFLKNDT